jgi:uncharacterized hydrophobic protein (TIGR00271 family)
VQDRVAAAFEISGDDRSTRVATLLSRSRRGSAAYWLQLVLAMTIATLGLILDSTAVVIGAMLVSPLMSPIVELGMGLAVGSPLLVLRSFSRVAKSTLLVVAGAAAITLVLPFHETTSEIAARTSPTALDLLVAVCCAIAAAYAQVRPASETASTAAGTAIGIALVPPLCVVGYGLGTGSSDIAKGSALLFTANLCAILLFAVFCFLLSGFDRANIRSLEEEELAQGGQSLATRIGRALARLFASKYGWPSRLVMPIVLVAAVYVPLRRALDEVSWEVRVRREAERILATIPHAVQVSLSVKRHAVSLRLITIGGATEVDALRRDLESRISSVAHVKPKVEIVAVPDADALRVAAAREVVAPQPAPEPPLPHARRLVAEGLAVQWPSSAAGPLARWALELAGESVRVEVVHVGAPLGAAGEALLASDLSARLDTKVTIHDVAISALPIVADSLDTFVVMAAQQAAVAASVEGVYACLRAPRATPAGGDASIDASEADAALDLAHSPLFALAAAKGRLEISEGDRFELRLSLHPCPAIASDAGADAPSLRDETE